MHGNTFIIFSIDFPCTIKANKRMMMSWNREMRLTGQVLDSDPYGWYENVLFRDERWGENVFSLIGWSLMNRTDRTATEKQDNRYNTNPLVAMASLRLTNWLSVTDWSIQSFYNVMEFTPQPPLCVFLHKYPALNGGTWNQIRKGKKFMPTQRFMKREREREKC